MTAGPGAPTVAVVVPCHDEEAYAGPILDALASQLAGLPGWRVVAVDDASTDGTLAELRARAAAPGLTIVSGRYGSPGGARSAGVAAALDVAHAAGEPEPAWIVTVDADVELAPTWAADWAATLAEVDGDEGVGAVNGVEDQGHLWARFPNASRAGAGFGLGLGRGESLVGVTNLNGVNHGVRTAAYRTVGPYTMPTAPGPEGTRNLAGEDWDLGVRLRLAGWSVAETRATVVDRGRRLLADVHAYVSGEAYEGAFRRVHGDGAPRDIDAALVGPLFDAALVRSLRHFFLKPLLAGCAPLDASTGLSPATLDAMRAWTARWPHPTFLEDRNGFVFGRLARFADAFTDAVRADLRLTPADVQP